MIKAVGYIGKIPKGDAITNKLHARVACIEEENIKEIVKIASIVAISLDS
jgi:hypothetical protein